MTVQLEPGQIIGGRYEIGKLLGQGGMGSVYEVRHTGTRKRMALKVITADVTQHPGLVARFQVEARAAGAIESQHIAQVFDVGSDDTLKTPYMAMEFLVGEDLEHLIFRVGVLPPELALRIVAQALVGLETAHAADVVHRDLKPANIYVTKREGEEIVIKLLDFGIAKILQEQDAADSSPGLTRTGSLIGSPLYMSPEQARGRRGGIDQRTDLWSIGIVLYQILCGRTPHQDNDAMGDLIIAICSDPAPSVQDYAPWVQPEIADILHKALQIEVENRYQTAGEMLADIRALLPHGSALTKSMLGALDPESRAIVAPKSTSRSGMTGEQPRKLTTGPGANRTTGAGVAQAMPTQASAGMTGAALAGASSTTDALATDTAPSKPSRTPYILGSAAAAVVLGTVVAFTLFGGKPSAPEPSPASSSIAAPAPTTAEPAAPPTPSAAPAATPSAAPSASAAPAAPVVTPQAPAPNTSVPIGYPTKPAPTPSATPAAPPPAAPPPPPQPPPKKNPLDVDIK